MGSAVVFSTVRKNGAVLAALTVSDGANELQQCTTPLDCQAKRRVRSPLWDQVEPIGPIYCPERWISSCSGRSPTVGPQHAYGIAARIEQVANQLLRLNQGTLYPALVRLEQKG